MPYFFRRGEKEFYECWLPRCLACVRTWSKERGPKGDKKREKSRGQSKTLKRSRVEYWNYGKRGHVKKECRVKKKNVDSSIKKVIQ